LRFKMVLTSSAFEVMIYYAISRIHFPFLSFNSTLTHRKKENRGVLQVDAKGVLR
jgi:hypothetical protein